MDIAQNIAITPEQERVLRELLQRHLPDTTAWLYGSRVTGKARLRSDQDMVVFSGAWWAGSGIKYRSVQGHHRKRTHHFDGIRELRKQIFFTYRET
jgi:predicted nucleotidyltransferase